MPDLDNKCWYYEWYKLRIEYEIKREKREAYIERTQKKGENLYE